MQRQWRILILTPSAHRELEPSFVTDVKGQAWGESKVKVAGAFDYVEKHGASIAALHPELTPLDAWAEFAGNGTMTSASGRAAPVFNTYVVPVLVKDGVGSLVKVGPVNASILARGWAGHQKTVYFLVCGDVTTKRVGPVTGFGLEGRDMLKLGAAEVRVLTEAAEDVLLADVKAADVAAEGEE